ncbi:MAG TPA: hypothetical protein VFQ53_42540 [Kofleriaceae bacterium]|nr:hypothetical protein [Kofleriaceae bacterium]
MKRRESFTTGAICALALIAFGACGDSPKGRTFYERNVEPILVQKCAGNTSGCHSTNEGDPFAIAAGNFDVTSFENVQKRRDVLSSFGAYPYPLLLIKAVGPGRLKLQYGGEFRNIDVQHSGGGIIDVGSDAYFTLQSWLDNGATENGLRPATPPVAGTGGCSTEIPAGFDPSQFNTLPGFDTFKTNVQPILGAHGCNVSSCHGAPQSDFYITCGQDEDQLAFNFSQAWAFVNNPVDDSQLLRVPLAVGAGGRGHTGGDQFDAIDNPEFQTIRAWAESVGVRDFANGDPNKQFFAANVQPLLVQRGCAFQACHSPQGPNDFKLRTGAPGFFSAVALQKNYDLLKHEFMALEFPDARRGRAVAKALLEDDPRLASVGGIAHRGGPVLETPGTPADPAACPATFDPATATAFCTIQHWLDLERAADAANVTSMNPGDPIRIVYVERPAGSASAGRLEFDEFHGGAEIRVATTSFGAEQSINAADAGGGIAISNACGITGGDMQSPNVSNDGTRVVFAGRATANEPLGIFIATIDGATCNRVTPPAPDSNGLKVHNFDPVFSPDGQYIVFASTRGKPGTGALKSRKRFLPQSDLWRVRVNGTTVDDSTLEQMTFLSNSEVSPGFMREGRVIMTTEKASASFYQLSGRRMNWDLTDYHPLLAQRKDSPYADPTNLATTLPSIGYSSATDIRESSDGDFLLILSDVNADGTPTLPGAAGALAIFNRSIGPFEQGRNDVGYLKSVRIIDEASATGRAGSPGGYRHPVALPDGTIMAAFASNVAQGNFDIVAVNPRDGSRRALFTNPNGRVRVDAVLAYKSPPRQLYANRRQLVFGGAADQDPATAIVHMPHAPSLFTLLTGNLRRGRPVDAFDAARFLAVYLEQPCPAGNCTPNANGIFESRTLLGKASLSDDGSVAVRLPSGTGVILELQDGDGNPIVTMSEEHQLGPGERVSMGVPRALFDGVCGGCHGSISGRELDVSITPDALTGASQSTAATALPKSLP